MPDPAPHGSRRPIIVQKYGGSSVADIDRLRRVADRVVAARRDGYDVVVVVSAMGKTTDGLLTLARTAAARAAPPFDPPRRELDMLLSTGERVSMALLSIAIQSRGLDAISFTGSQSGILTNDRHFDARIIEVRPHRIEDELARGKIVIVAGYQGMSYRREITTLGRGGSDTTAVALAAALEAERCEIYSDVDGVYSADPRAVPDARHLPEIDHAMLQEMAESGAKVICAQAVEWARRAGIAIYARSSFDPGNHAPRHTIVRKLHPAEELSARAITSEGQIAFGRIDGNSGLDDLLRGVEAAHVALKDLSAGPACTTFVIPLLNVPDWNDAKQKLLSQVPSLVLSEGVATVSVVGGGLASTVEPLRRFAATLRDLGENPLSILANPLRLSAVVGASCAASAQRALHEAFIAP